jgi:hypothetical protein
VLLNLCVTELQRSGVGDAAATLLAGFQGLARAFGMA